MTIKKKMIKVGVDKMIEIGVDKVKEMIGETFVIENPKATASCGCGLSFSV